MLRHIRSQRLGLVQYIRSQRLGPVQHIRNRPQVPLHSHNHCRKKTCALEGGSKDFRHRHIRSQRLGLEQHHIRSRRQELEHHIRNRRLGQVHHIRSRRQVPLHNHNLPQVQHSHIRQQSDLLICRIV